jgi:hypothetical protein
MVEVCEISWLSRRASTLSTQLIRTASAFNFQPSHTASTPVVHIFEYSKPYTCWSLSQHTMKREEEAYVISFLSAWLGAASTSLNYSADSAPIQDQHLQPSLRSLQDEIPIDAQSLRIKIDDEEQSMWDTESDTTHRSLTQPRLSVSTHSTSPRGSEDGNNRISDVGRISRLNILGRRRRHGSSPIKSLPANEYTTIYPASWTISSANSPRPTTPVVDLDTELAVNPLIHMNENATSRTASTTSQGDVGPLSPMRRRMQRDFLSMSQASPRPKKSTPPRASSVNIPASGLNRIERLFGVKPQPKSIDYIAPQATIQAKSNLPDRHTSENSNYSTFPRQMSLRERSQADTPANHRAVSTAYSAYGDA